MKIRLYDVLKRFDERCEEDNLPLFTDEQLSEMLDIPLDNIRPLRQLVREEAIVTKMMMVEVGVNRIH